jgi:hypothetical protein
VHYVFFARAGLGQTDEPTDLKRIIGEILYIFHQYPPGFEKIGVAELIEWRNLAVSIHNRAHGAK